MGYTDTAEVLKRRVGTAMKCHFRFTDKRNILSICRIINSNILCSAMYGLNPKNTAISKETLRIERTLGRKINQY